MLVSASHEEGAIPDLSAELLTGVLDFAGETAGEVMVPGDAICAVPLGATTAEIEDVVRERAHTRVLLRDRQRPERVVGFVHSKDLLMVDDAEVDQPLPWKMIRRNLTVGPEEPLESLLLAMQRRRIHVAVVVAPDGTAQGMVTLDDLLERLVRDITDELSE